MELQGAVGLCDKEMEMEMEEEAELSWMVEERQEGKLAGWFKRKKALDPAI